VYQWKGYQWKMYPEMGMRLLLYLGFHGNVNDKWQNITYYDICIWINWILMWDLRFSLRWLWRSLSSGIQMLYPEDGGITFLWNINKYLAEYKVSHPRSWFFIYTQIRASDKFSCTPTYCIWFICIMNWYTLKSITCYAQVSYSDGH
jgi:hypothetical protein